MTEPTRGYPADSGLIVALAIASLTALSFLWFPGHTFLQADTQIYIPILQHMENPEVLSRDVMAVRPHVGFTIYDEVVRGLHGLAGVSFEGLLTAQQILFRALGIIGLYLVARRAGLSGVLSYSVAAMVSLGAVVAGPTVLTVEYEPLPRGFSLPLLLLSLGLLASEKRGWAAFAATVSWALHPPTAMPFAALLGLHSLLGRRWRELLLLGFGPLLILVSALTQPATAEHASLFSTIPQALEAIQRMRASYNWVDMWIGRYWFHYLLLFGASTIAAWRLRASLPREVLSYLVLLPTVGVLSVPLSYVLLDMLKWGAVPQYQPGRYLLFLSLFGALSCAISGLLAAGNRRYPEAFFFLLVPFILPLEGDILSITPGRVALAVALAGAVVLLRRFPWLVPVPVLLAFALYPTLGSVRNFAAVRTPELEQLCNWAHASTPQSSVFQFADVRRGVEPGVLRASAERAIYADWKAGGQVNFLPDFAYLWADRWKQVERPQSLRRYRELGIDYVVFSAGKAPKDAKPVFSNSRWAAFRTRQ